MMVIEQYSQEVQITSIRIELLFSNEICRNNNNNSDKRCASDRQHKAKSIGLFFFFYFRRQIKICIKIEQMKNQ